MLSPTKLNFLFYDFSVIYYNFLKTQRKYKKKEKNNTTFIVAKPLSKIA
jgi:hypothetical protein